MPMCAICGFEDDNEIVSHLKSKHEGGLQKYQLFFPTPVVNRELFTACENAHWFKYVDYTVPGMANLTEEDRKIIVESALRRQPARSEIIQTLDF